jgi:mRNA-degrading endonuclease toxin of MazEF toxin-antitoxin module
VRIPVDLGVLEQESVINVTQIATIDRCGLDQRIGALPDWLLAQLDAGVRRALDLSRV